MEITERHEQGVTIALLTGKMDAESVPVFRQWFDGRMAAGQDRFILDFGGVGYLSSAGLRAVLLALKSLDRQQGRMAICGLYGITRQVFQVSGVLKIVPDCPGVPEALAVFQETSA